VYTHTHTPSLSFHSAQSGFFSLYNIRLVIIFLSFLFIFALFVNYKWAGSMKIQREQKRKEKKKQHEKNEELHRQ
jgi:hypothetical protein